VIGQNPFDIEDLWFKLYQFEHNAGPVMYAAIAGIETALWDIVGKAGGQPVYNLAAGNVRSKVKAYTKGRYRHSGDIQEPADHARQVVARDYQTLEFEPFGCGG